MIREENPAQEKHKRTTARRITGDVLILLILLFAAYLCAVMPPRIHAVVLQDAYRKIFYYQLILCGGLLLLALDLRFAFLTKSRARLPHIAGWILRLAGMAFALLLLFFCGRAVTGGLIHNAEEAENVIVLGMALEKGQPTADLLLRLNTARQYLEAHPQAKLILSGGNPDKTGVTEAAVMQALLLSHGVPPDCLILEDQAPSTRENFLHAAEILDTDAPVVIVSSNYHMDRAVKMARAAGFTHIMRLPAPSEPLYYGANITREILLDLRGLILGR
ncbi:MAG: YdcF family protein [Firmicutes bacterium]|nr:YdcF family protein [Bacillota bacterium]